MRGSIRPRGDGSWEVRLRVPDPQTGKSKQRSWTVRGTRRDAERELALLLTDLYDGRLSGEDTRVASHLDHWLAVQERRLADKTIRSYRGLMERHVVPDLGGFDLGALTTRQIDGLYRRLLDAGYSPRTVRYVHTVFRRALADAVRWGVLDKNPADGATPPAQERKPKKVWVPEQAREWVKEVRESGHMCGPVWVLTLVAGLRRGEACGLRWDEIDDRAVSIRRSYSLGGDGKPVDREPKAGSYRTVTIDRGTAEWLKSVPRPSEYVSADFSGARLHPETVSKTFQRWSVARGYPKITYHELRHTSASLAFNAGVPLKVVSGRLGHASVQITGDIYVHASDALDEVAADEIGRLLGGG